MSSTAKTFSLIILALGLLIAGFSLFVVEETERAIVLRLGKIINNSSDEPKVLRPGLHAKVPFIDRQHLLDWRIQSLEINASRIPTKEKKELIVDLFTKWRIEDPGKFFINTNGDKKRAEQLLRAKIVDGLRGELGRRELKEVVSSERQSVMEKIRHDANQTAKTLGIIVVDARIMRIELPPQVSQQVYSVMRTERERIAQQHRARGQSRAEGISAQADRKVIVIKATAESQASLARGEGDAKASQIYADTYGKDPEFYSFYRSLEAYRHTFKGNNDMLVIRPDDSFFKYFRNKQGTSAPTEVRKS